MPPHPLKAAVFDAYGTLFDLSTPVSKALTGFDTAQAAAFTNLWRAKQLEYTWLRSLMNAYAPFDVVTADALDFTLKVFEKSGNADLRHRLLSSYRLIDAYQDAAAALRTLKQAGLRTAILSNGTPDMLSAAVTAAGFNDMIEAILSVEQVRVYKPAPVVYQLAVDTLNLAPHEIAFVSSNGWDAAGAAQYGFFTIHVNRSGSPTECLPKPFNVSISGLAELEPLLRRAGRL